MLDEELLLLAQQFLDSPEGKKLLENIGFELDVESINRKIKESEDDLSREERREARKAKRVERRNEREKRKEERREARKEEIQQLRAQLKANIPVIREYPISGKVYWLLNANDNPDYSGVSIKVLKGALVKKENGEKIPESSLQTQPDGSFNIRVKTVVLPSKVTINVEDDNGENEEREFSFRDNDVVILRPQLIFTKNNIPPVIRDITNRDNTIKSDLGTKVLLTVEQQAKAAINEAQIQIDRAQSQLNPLYYDAVENALTIRRGVIMDVNNVIKSRLIPLVVTLLISFGITKISQSPFKTCPTPEQLQDNVRRRNRVVRQLNQAFSTIVVNVGLAAIFKVLQNLLKNVAQTLRNVPLPLATQPYSTVGQLQEAEQTIEELEKANKDLNRETIIALVFLVSSITTVLVLLNALDKLTEECAGELNLEFEPINEELQDLTQEQVEEGFSLVTQVNGFTMGIELEKNTIGSLTRRYAVAKNKQGVVQLKGEPSFSATDQVLIDELAFYITTNNLKAF